MIPYLVLDSFFMASLLKKTHPNRLPLAGDQLVSVNGSTFESQKASSKKTPNGGTTNAMSKNSFGSRSQTRLLEEIDGNIDKVMEVPNWKNRSILGESGWKNQWIESLCWCLEVKIYGEKALQPESTAGGSAEVRKFREMSRDACAGASAASWYAQKVWR